MKSKKSEHGPVTGALVKELTERQKTAVKTQMQKPGIGSTPLAQPALYQDPGSGYNSNFTFPQD
ncbi:MAG TPA: hypothetical protein VK604_04825 [Bryobacteraceae bacterium]|nr:hypothetical protein [Bryobacteraceae bacterium]